MFEITTRSLSASANPKVHGPIEPLARIVGFFTAAGGEVVDMSFGSGFFDPMRPGFVVTAAHCLDSAAGLAGSVKIKVYDQKGARHSLWGADFALLEDYRTAGIGGDIAVVRLQTPLDVLGAPALQRPGEGHFPAHLSAYNTDASFDHHVPQTSVLDVQVVNDHLVYQGGTATDQMSGAPVIRSAGSKATVAGVHKGIVGGQFVAARIDLNLLHALYNALP